MSGISLRDVCPKAGQLKVSLLAGAVVILPALLASTVLWEVLSQQIYSSYEKRLSASLETFGLIMENRHRNLSDALTRIAADNTVQVTLSLDIRPQLRRYLHSQYKLTGLDFIHVVDGEHRPLASIGETATGATMAPGVCAYSDTLPSEDLIYRHDRLLLTRSVPIRQKSRLVGYLCGGLTVTDEAFIHYLRDKLGGVPLFGWEDLFIRPTGPEGPALESRPVGQMFDYRSADGSFKGMLGVAAVGDREMTLGFLVPLEDLKQGIGRAMGSVGIVLLAVATIALFALRTFYLRRQAESQLQQEKERAVVTLASIADGVVTTDGAGMITYLNPAAERMTGYTSAQAVARAWQSILHIREEETGAVMTDPLLFEAGSTTYAARESVLARPDGEEIAIHFSSAPIDQHDSQANGVVFVLRDVGPQRELQRRLEWKASRDDLTGLYNRAEFRRRVAASMNDARVRDLEHSLLYLDLDEFKVVNDSCGHGSGDQLLKQIGATLLSRTRVSDTVARLGGDEFGILLPGCPLDRAVELANGLLESLNDQRFGCRNRVFDVGASIGLVPVNAKTQDLEDLMASVDAACYVAKEQGRNRVHVGRLDTQQIGRRLGELKLVSKIRQALKEDRFILYHQPIVSVDSADDLSDAHGEILLRMLDEQGKELPPGAFIPVAERHGLMPDIDRWVIARVFSTQSHWYRAAATRLQTAAASGPDARDTCVFTINLSGASVVEEGFLSYVVDKLQEHKIPGEVVCFEITETSVITHLDKAIHFIAELKKLGCRFLLDDFGSGMSSFGYLKNLPVDYLKIDGLFVKDMVNDPIDYAMVKAINDIGHVMRLKTIAEFVENDDILQELRIIGVDMAQGYGIAVPCPLDEVRRTESAPRATASRSG